MVSLINLMIFKITFVEIIEEITWEEEEEEVDIISKIIIITIKITDNQINIIIVQNVII